MTEQAAGDICPQCNREFRGGLPDRAQLVIQEHRSHLSARALAAGGYVEAENGSYGCETGCEFVRYEVYDAKDALVATHGEFGESDPDTLREWAAYYGVEAR